jgi:predicted enzyme related to lactoylglutathione lyase
MRGKPLWWDILVDDLDVAQRFYSAVFGWTFPISGPDFVVVFDGTEQVASSTHQASRSLVAASECTSTPTI